MTMPERWIVIPKWDEFQHPDALRTGNIPWLKTYTRLLSDDAYLSLTATERAVLHGIWLEHARSRGQTPLKPGSLTRRLNLKVREQHIQALVHAGFIAISASKPASSLQAPLQAKTRREEKDLRARAQGQTKTQNGGPVDPRLTTHRFVCPICPCREQFDFKLVEHLYNVHGLMQAPLEDAVREAGLSVDCIPEHIPRSHGGSDA